MQDLFRILRESLSLKWKMRQRKGKHSGTNLTLNLALWFTLVRKLRLTLRQSSLIASRERGNFASRYFPPAYTSSADLDTIN